MTELWAFDFDGVICDSAEELCIACWKALRQCVGGLEEWPSEQIIVDFRFIRPILHTGYEGIMFLYLLVVGHTPREEIKQRFHSDLQSVAMTGLGSTVAQLKNMLQQTREEWIACDRAEWLSRNRFYDEVLHHIHKIVECGAQVYVITTKDRSITLELLAAAGLPINADRVFGLGSGAKEAVLAEILTKAGEVSRCFFIEDRVETLVTAQPAPGLEKVQFVLARWGYNTDSAADIAAEKGFFVANSPSELSQL